VPRIEGKFLIENKIQELRAQKSITQQELADALEVTRATVVALEKGSYNPSLELAFRVSRFFGEDLESVFKIKGVKQ
jgi:putative transcriptional regulator